MRSRPTKRLLMGILVGLAAFVFFATPLCTRALSLTWPSQMRSPLMTQAVLSGVALEKSVPESQPTLSPTLEPTDVSTVTAEPGTTTSPGQEDKGGLSNVSLDDPWLIVACGCAAILGVLSVVLVVYLLRRKRRSASSRKQPTAPLPVAQQVVNQPKTTSLLWTSPAHLTPVGGQAGAPPIFELKPEGIKVGRAQDNDLIISSAFPGWETVSQHHARIYKQGAYWVVEDLNSQNGVYVNRRRTGCNVLHDEWTLEFGGVGFVFHPGKGERES